MFVPTLHLLNRGGHAYPMLNVVLTGTPMIFCYGELLSSFMNTLALNGLHFLNEVANMIAFDQEISLHFCIPI
jgi:hypothetical protein